MTKYKTRKFFAILTALTLVISTTTPMNNLGTPSNPIQSIGNVLEKIFGIKTAHADPGANIFELDGNIVTNTATPPPDDWDHIFTDTASGPCTLLSTLPSSFISGTVPFCKHDDPTPDTSYFSTGSKDTNPISSGNNPWNCGTISNPTGKDNLLRGFAYAAKSTSSGDEFFFVGGIREPKTQGSADWGVWFLKDSTIAPTCTTADKALQRVAYSRNRAVIELHKAVGEGNQHEEVQKLAYAEPRSTLGRGKGFQVTSIKSIVNDPEFAEVREKIGARVTDLLRLLVSYGTISKKQIALQFGIADDQRAGLAGMEERATEREQRIAQMSRELEEARAKTAMHDEKKKEYEIRIAHITKELSEQKAMSSRLEVEKEEAESEITWVANEMDELLMAAGLSPIRYLSLRAKFEGLKDELLASRAYHE